jgi:cell division cycle 20-like protein 1 (cofactor of APC complex)
MLQVSTRGDLQNQIFVWKYPGLTQLASPTGRSSGVHSVAVSPDGEAGVTGAGDVTFRFWNMFGKARSQNMSAHFIHWENIFLMDRTF